MEVSSLASNMSDLQNERSSQIVAPSIEYTIRIILVCSLGFLTCSGLEQYVAFDAASASSTYSAGNLVIGMIAFVFVDFFFPLPPIIF